MHQSLHTLIARQRRQAARLQHTRWAHRRATRHYPAVCAHTSRAACNQEVQAQRHFEHQERQQQQRVQRAQPPQRRMQLPSLHSASPSSAHQSKQRQQRAPGDHTPVHAGSGGVWAMRCESLVSWHPAPAACCTTADPASPKSAHTAWQPTTCTLEPGVAQRWHIAACLVCCFAGYWCRALGSAPRLLHTRDAQLGPRVGHSSNVHGAHARRKDA